MRRLGRVLRAFWAVNLEEELQYRANLVASVLSTLFWLGMAVLTAVVFFARTPVLGGWRFWEVVALLGIFNAVAGVVDALLRPNLGQIVELVRSGKMDLVLAKPIDPQFHVSFRRLVVWRFSDVALGLALSFFALARLGRVPSVGEVAAFALSFSAALGIVYAIWVALMSLAFWFVAVENLSVLFDVVYDAARFPVSAYPGTLRFTFVFLLPIAWITTVPAAALTGRGRWATALLAVAVALVLLLLSRLVWRTALRRYTSAGG